MRIAQFYFPHKAFAHPLIPNPVHHAEDSQGCEAPYLAVLILPDSMLRVGIGQYICEARQEVLKLLCAVLGLVWPAECTPLKAGDPAAQLQRREGLPARVSPLT